MSFRQLILELQAHLELQAPQGPYTNILALQVFPAMSKKHSELSQIFSNTQADTERIWKIALEIWNGITSAMIARAFIRLTSEFEKRGWHLELQAPQGPYTNVLDLQVFLAMSKKHSELLQIFSNTQADTERIWKIALEIWNGITSAMIARAFILAHRIMSKIVETKGDTEWLKNGTPHCHVCRDFFDSDRGVMKISDVVDVVEDQTEPYQCY
jgi:hypothetical protein